VCQPGSHPIIHGPATDCLGGSARRKKKRNDNAGSALGALIASEGPGERGAAVAHLSTPTPYSVQVGMVAASQLLYGWQAGAAMLEARRKKKGSA